MNDNSMSSQEPKSRSTSSKTATSDNSMSSQEPKSRSTSSKTATSDNRMSCQEATSRTTSSTSATSDNRISSQKSKSRMTSSATSDNRTSCQKPKPMKTSSTATSENRTSCQKPKSRRWSLSFLILFIAIVSLIGVVLYSEIAEPPHTPADPKPTQWPDQFHATIVMNNSGIIELVDLWYDWTNGRSFNIIRSQHGSVVYDLEWNNGTSFYYTVGSDGTCSSAHMEGTEEGGILKPDWLSRMSYVGQRKFDGSYCSVWEIAKFITYYEDVFSKRPVHWVFYTGRKAHVMKFEVGATLEDAKLQAPCYCFEQTDATELAPMDVGAITHRGLVDSGIELAPMDVGAITHVAAVTRMKKWSSTFFTFSKQTKATELAPMDDLVDSGTLIRAVTQMKEWSSTFFNFSEQTKATELAPMDVGAVTHRGLVDCGTLIRAFTQMKEWSSTFLNFSGQTNATEVALMDVGAITHRWYSDTLVRAVARMKEWSSTFVNFIASHNHVFKF